MDYTNSITYLENIVKYQIVNSSKVAKEMSLNYYNLNEEILLCLKKQTTN